MNFIVFFPVLFKKPKIFLVIFLFCSLFFIGPIVNSSLNQDSVFPDTQWIVNTPESQGMQFQFFKQLEDTIISNNYQVKSVLVLKSGFLIYEKYFDISDDLFTHRQVYSVTKSIVSTLLGISIDKGYINSTKQKVLDYFPELQIDNVNTEKQEMTIEDLLKMASGLDWDEWTYSYEDDRNNAIKMYYSSNWVQFVLNRSIVYTPGMRFTYNSGVSHVLGAIVQKAVNVSLYQFAKENLFNPIGIFENETSWDIATQNITNGGWGLKMTPRALARIGLLFDNNGIWNGNQIVSSNWVENATRSQIKTNSGGSYGYQWWIDSTGFSFSARGYQGQYIIVAPEKNLVVIFTSVITNGGSPYSLYQQFIVPAIDSTTISIPGNNSTISTITTNSIPTSSYPLISISFLLLCIPFINKKRMKT
jgi:CubicO group peptidase (beta-lactamase class C family)